MRVMWVDEERPVPSVDSPYFRAVILTHFHQPFVLEGNIPLPPINDRLKMSVPLDVVKTYSPVFRFHENEKYYPCSIEYLLQNSTLLYRNFSIANQITGQSTSDTPAIASFNGWLYMVYRDSNGFDLYVTRSPDGITWQDTQKISGVQGGSPTLVEFENKLWLIWHGLFSAQLWIAHSEDGLHFEGIQKIAGQKAWNTAITVYDGELFMVYADSASSQLWMSQSADGSTWTNTRHIDGQMTTNPAVTTFEDNVVMVYVDPGIDTSTLFVSTYTSQKGWTPAKVISGQQASAPALTTFENCLFMTYSEPNNSQQFWASRSFDINGVHWQDTQRLPGQHGDIPSLCVFHNSIYMVYRDGTQLWSTSCQEADLSTHTPIPNPTQATLSKYSSESYYVLINESQFTGQPVPAAPLYYAIQESGDTIQIDYLILYAYQGGQTVRALRAGTEFNCILETIGVHQGDLEHFNIKLQKGANNTYTVLQVGFEAHGILDTFAPDQVQWEDTTHAIVHIALTGHACRNHDPKDGPVIEFSQPGAVAVGSWLGSGTWWRPSTQGSEFKRLGLNNLGNPIDDQIWSAFRGRLGDTKVNSLIEATYFDGSNLSAFDWVFVETIFGFATVLSILPTDLLIGDAPTGPGVRPWITS